MCICKFVPLSSPVKWTLGKGFWATNEDVIFSSLIHRKYLAASAMHFVRINSDPNLTVLGSCISQDPERILKSHQLF